MIHTVRVKFYMEYAFDVETLLGFVNEHDFITSNVIGPYKQNQVADVTYSDDDPYTLILTMQDKTTWRVPFSDEMEYATLLDELNFERLDKEDINEKKIP